MALSNLTQESEQYLKDLPHSIQREDIVRMLGNFEWELDALHKQLK